MIEFSGSGYGQARRCPASQVLPRFDSVSDKATFGDGFHEHMQQRATLGISVAMENLEVLARRYDLVDEDFDWFVRRAKAFSFVPPRGTIAELPLGLREDGSVVVVTGGKGRYDGDAVFAATIDAMWSEPEPFIVGRGQRPRVPPGSILWVSDYKTGKEEYTDPIEINRQAWGTALLAARYTDAALIMPAICYPSFGAGTWDTLGHPVTRDALDWIATEIALTVKAIQVQRERIEGGLPPMLVEGPHCTYCPAFTNCPAKVALMKRALDGEVVPKVEPGQLTDSQRIRLAAGLPQLRRMLKTAEDLLKADTRLRGPVDLGDGNLWGPNPHVNEIIDPDIGREILAVEVGAELAQKALKVELPKGAIEAAIKEAHQKAGIERQRSKAMGRVFGRLREAKGIREETETWYSAYRPKKQ